jgi:hypothetical protein
MKTIELSELAGEHTLTGVLLEESSETPDHYAKCRFTLDGITYRVDEDGDDGYRSYAQDCEQTEEPPILQFDVTVTVVHRTEENGDECNIIRMIDGSGNEIFRVGTDHTDDYYPLYVCEFDRSLIPE